MKSSIKKLIDRIFRDSRVRAFCISLIIVVGVAVVTLPLTTFAQNTNADRSGLDQTSGVSGFIAGIILWIVALLGRLLLVVIGIVIDIAQYNNFIDAPAVQTGWVIVRDVSNMFFILVLLVIAFGTIFRIEQYRYQKLLGKLILMAILINLSKFIAGFFIDLTQVIMLTFVNAFKDAAAGNFTSMFQLENILKFRNSPTPPGAADTVGGAIYALVLVVVALVVMVVFMVVLLIRVIMLWILVILSPLAYMLSTFPGSNKYSGQWWNMFWKHAVTGPVVAFFIWLALTVSVTSTADVVNSVSGAPDADQRLVTTTQEEGTLAATVSEASTAENFLSYAFNVMMLVAGLMAAQQVGGIAGGFAGNALSRLQRAGGTALSAPLKVAGLPLLGAAEIAKGRAKALRRFYEDRTPAWAQPWNIVKGAKERGEELDKMSRTAAVAKARQQWERLSTRGAVVIPHLDKAEASFEAQFAKDFSTMTKEEKAEAAKHLWEGLKRSPSSPELNRRMRALVHIAANGGHLDDIMQDNYFKYEAEWKDEKGNVRHGFADKKTGKFYSRAPLREFLRNAVGGKGGNDQQGLRLVYELEEIGKKVKHQEYGGYTVYDTKLGKHRWLTEEEAIAKAIAELAKTTGRALLGDSPHDFVALREVQDFKRDEDGNIMTDEKGNYMMDESKTRTTGADMDNKFYRKAFERAFRSQPDTRIVEHTQARTANYLLGGDSSSIDKKTGAIVGDKMDEDRIKYMLEEWYQAPTGFWEKVGGEGLLKFQQVDFSSGQKEGSVKDIFDFFQELADEKGWSENEKQERLGEIAGQYTQDKKKWAGLSDAEKERVNTFAPAEKKGGEKKEGEEKKKGEAGEAGPAPATPPPPPPPSGAGGGGAARPAPAEPTAAGVERQEMADRTTRNITEAEKTVEVIETTGAGGRPGSYISEKGLEPLTNSIQELSRALEATSAALSAPTFGRLLEDNITKLAKVMENFPEDLRKRILDNVQPMQESSSTGEVRTRDDQDRIYQILKAIRDAFGKNRTEGGTV